ncbi:MAG: hypothetical protein ABIQ10_01780 [Gemmatimonadaceae bacterium]
MFYFYYGASIKQDELVSFGERPECATDGLFVTLTYQYLVK